MTLSMLRFFVLSLVCCAAIGCGGSKNSETDNLRGFVQSDLFCSDVVNAITIDQLKSRPLAVVEDFQKSRPEIGYRLFKDECSSYFFLDGKLAAILFYVRKDKVTAEHDIDRYRRAFGKPTVDVAQMPPELRKSEVLTDVGWYKPEYDLEVRLAEIRSAEAGSVILWSSFAVRSKNSKLQQRLNASRR